MIRTRGEPLRWYTRRLRRALQEKGLLWLCRAFWQRSLFPVVELVLTPLAIRRIRMRVARDPSREWMIFVSTLDWNFPFRQRGHHLVRAFHQLGKAIVFVTKSAGYDRLTFGAEINDGFIITSFRDAAIEAVTAPLVYFASTDAGIGPSVLERIRSANGRIIYDYVDAFDDRVSTSAITATRRQVHRCLLEDEKGTFCIATAERLFAEIAAHRRDRFALVTNGVDSADFQVNRSTIGLREDFAAIVARQRPIVGYYGALAEWLDYDLITGLAKRCPNICFVVMGPDIDGSGARLDNGPPNLHVLAPIAYQDLPRHAAWFDVGLIPFITNPITEATSPLKLFEYMALGLPIVSTDLAECRRYPSVATARTLDEAADLVAKAIYLRGDVAHTEMLTQEAERNDWRHKAQAILDLVDRGRHNGAL
jgi:teichuronic acid biosynthesis glycosyltransferase TuaH